METLFTLKHFTSHLLISISRSKATQSDGMSKGYNENDLSSKSNVE